MTQSSQELQAILEAVMMVAGRPVSKKEMQHLFEDTPPSGQEIEEALLALREKYHIAGGIELQEVASGFQLQAKKEYSHWLQKLWEERPPRYSRAILETLALIAYRQPITRAEIESIRGVAVSSHIMKTLTERHWVKVIGFKETPGKPALYATTKLFLDDFNLQRLDQLPPLAAIKQEEAALATSSQTSLPLESSIENIK